MTRPMLLASVLSLIGLHHSAGAANVEIPKERTYILHCSAIAVPIYAGPPGSK
ncbi:MAG: hypothetical protein J0H14_04660 [Alphaproteobacteria bacterium]|nr:hypothetical protein [Alphaproteobacteria bacterium]